MPKKVKDPQAKALYAAEDAVPSQEFGSLDEFDAFLTDVMETKWFKDRWPLLVGISTHDGRGTSYASGRSIEFGNIMVGEISVPKGNRSAIHGLHELAHVCDPRHILLHDEVFAGIELALVGLALGRRMRRRLQTAFVEHEVVWKIYRHG